MLAIVAVTAGSTGLQTRAPASIPECQHDWGEAFKIAGIALPGGELSLPKGITNVPEFHDCQKFVVNGAYTQLFAIFGAWDLGPRWALVNQNPTTIEVGRGFTIPQAQVGPTGGVQGTTTFRAGRDGTGGQPGLTPGARAYGMVEIYAEGSYRTLGISPGFNCAYFFLAQSKPHAVMVSYGYNEPDCSQPLGLDTASRFTLLAVTSVTNAIHPDDADYPAAARWDWDDTHAIQYFGVKCGTAWCEVGPNGLARSALKGNELGLPSPTITADPTFAAAVNRTHRVEDVKGWFDAQTLAPSNVTNPTKPSGVRGRLYPDPGLDARHQRSDFAGWKPSATAIIEVADAGYKTKLNLDPIGTSSGPMVGVPRNRIDLCYGPQSSCTGASAAPACAPYHSGDGVDSTADYQQWWSRIISAKGDTAYRCVTRRDHSKVDPKYLALMRGAVRWRWTARDETIWIGCAEGCCEVEVMCNGTNC